MRQYVAKTILQAPFHGHNMTIGEFLVEILERAFNPTSATTDLQAICLSKRRDLVISMALAGLLPEVELIERDGDWEIVGNLMGQTLQDHVCSLMNMTFHEWLRLATLSALASVR